MVVEPRVEVVADLDEVEAGALGGDGLAQELLWAVALGEELVADLHRLEIVSTARLCCVDGGAGRPSTTPPRTVGVLGAGTMGTGIAQLAAVSGARTLLYDPVAEALERGLGAAEAALDRQVEKGRMRRSEADAARGRIEPRISGSSRRPSS